jgi:hypothetical protein
MIEITCPLCTSGDGSIRIIRVRAHTWGDLVQYQCDECGAIIEVLNNIARKLWTFDEHPLLSTMRSALKDCGDGYAPENPTMKQQIKRVANQNERLQCEGCPVLFIPRKNAKSGKQTRFCPQCRDDGLADEIIAAEIAAIKKQNSASKKKPRSSKKKG